MTVVAKDDLHDTRQLLDELDALMDQMLSLPVNDAESAPDSSPEENRSSPVATPIVSARLTLVDPSGRLDEDAVAAPSAGTAATLPAVLTVVGSPPQVPLEPLPQLATPPQRPSGTLSYQFLVWVNQHFDRGADRLGPLGTFLRSRVGRAMLGMTGLSLLAVALAWLCKDWLGWNP